MDKIDGKSFENRYDEFWTLVVNDHEYELNPEDSVRVRQAVESGFKGVIEVQGAYLNLTYMQEFFLKKRELKSEFQLTEPEREEIKPISPEQQAIVKKKMEEFRQKFGMKKNTPLIPC